jgi:CHASE2 domain-containing sensor protein
MADIFAEKWMKGVAITTTCLAVMTAIAAARGQACMVKTQVLTGVESSKWAYYQAKSIKQNLAEMQKSIFEADIFGAENVHQDSLYRQKLTAAAEEVTRYGAEKEAIRKEAEETGALNRQIANKGNFFSGSIVFFQIAIMLSSVSALLKKKFPWIIGLALGVIALILLCYGLFLKPFMF